MRRSLRVGRKDRELETDESGQFHVKEVTTTDTKVVFKLLG